MLFHEYSRRYLVKYRYIKIIIMKVIITFDVERDWRWTPQTKKIIRTFDFPYTSKPKFKMIRKSLPKILNLLKKYNIKNSIFFVTGEVAKNEPELVKKIAKKYDIGVHTHPRFHPEFKGKHINDIKWDYLTKYSTSQIENMIKRDINYIQELNIEPKIFRAGMLNINIKVIKIIRKLGLMDSSVDLTTPFNLPFYFKVKFLIEELPISIGPGYIHQEKKYLLNKIFKGCLLLHPMPFGDPYINKKKKEIWFKKLDFFISKYGKKI